MRNCFQGEEAMATTSTPASPMNLGSFAVKTIMQTRTDPTMDASRLDMISERDGHPSRGSLLLVTKGRELGHHIINLDPLR